MSAFAHICQREAKVCYWPIRDLTLTLIGRRSSALLNSDGRQPLAYAMNCIDSGGPKGDAHPCRKKLHRPLKAANFAAQVSCASPEVWNSA